MKYWKKGITAMLVVIVTILCSSCTWYANKSFNPYEHIGTRWICNELDLYFDINEVMLNYADKELYNSPDRDTWCSGKLKINNEQFYIRVEFNPDRTISMYLQPNNELVYSDNDKEIMHAFDLRPTQGEIKIGLKDAILSSPLQYDGDVLTFECYEIPDGQRLYTLPTINIP